MDFGCVIGSLQHGQIPEKQCLLPLISKLLGYCIVAASTTVKLPQVYILSPPIPLSNFNIEIPNSAFFNAPLSLLIGLIDIIHCICLLKLICSLNSLSSL